MVSECVCVYGCKSDGKWKKKGGCNVWCFDPLSSRRFTPKRYTVVDWISGVTRDFDLWCVEQRRKRRRAEALLAREKRVGGISRISFFGLEGEKGH